MSLKVAVGIILCTRHLAGQKKGTDKALKMCVYRISVNSHIHNTSLIEKNFQLLVNNIPVWCHLYCKVSSFIHAPTPLTVSFFFIYMLTLNKFNGMRYLN